MLNQLLYLMTPFQQMRAVNAQLLRQMFGRYALGNAPQDQHDNAPGQGRDAQNY
jgi:hypothetical protein